MVSNRYIVLSLVLLFGAVIGCSGADESPPTTADLCSSNCAKMKSLNCPAEVNSPATECERLCNLVAVAQPACVSKYDKFLQCADGLPVAQFECNTAGQSDVKAPNCAAEHSAMDVCVIAD